MLKDSFLTPDEYSEIKNHPSIGVHILSSASIFEEIIPIVKHHHERYDGNGYPSQLKGEDIPLLVRLTTIVDSFDAMTSKRAYRDRLNLDVVKKELKNNIGTQFDPEICSAFLEILDNEPERIKEIQDKYSD